MKGLGPDWGTILGVPRVKHYTVGGGAGEGEDAHVGNFPKQASSLSQLGVWTGGKGYDAESSFCRGDTPALAGGDPMNKGFFFFPATQKTDIAN